ncbi:hypothetical protein J6590_088937 [Homalodisca vitripennis]|nr:hypothetical protein J6590_088937 [Homalodisca vitripennis]
MSIDVTLGLEDEIIEINNDVTQELDSQQAIIKALNEDLNEENTVIKQLRNHNIQLENIILKKEETIILLERQLNLNNQTKNPKRVSDALRPNAVNLQHSFPNLQSTPVSTNRTDNMVLNSNTNKDASFTLAVKGRKTCCIQSSAVKINKNLNSIFSNNRYEVLNVDEEEQSEDLRIVTSAEDCTKPITRKMLICADSHGRDLAWHLNKSQKTYDAVSFVRPGGRTKQILVNKNIEEANLSEQDSLVILCGTNDVARNEAYEVIDGISATLDKVKQTNIFLVDVPNRYDLANWSCVNHEVKKTNQRLLELSEMYNNVTLLEASKAERHLHTHQGLHFNYRGKKWLAEMIVSAVASKKKPDHQDRPNVVEKLQEEVNKAKYLQTDRCLPPLTPATLETLSVNNSGNCSENIPVSTTLPLSSPTNSSTTTHDILLQLTPFSKSQFPTLSSKQKNLIPTQTIKKT